MSSNSQRREVRFAVRDCSGSQVGRINLTEGLIGGHYSVELHVHQSLLNWFPVKIHGHVQESSQCVLVQNASTAVRLKAAA